MSMMYCVRSERRRSLMKWAMKGSFVMVARLAGPIECVPPCDEFSRQLTIQDLFGCADIAVLVRHDEIRHCQNLRVVLVPARGSAFAHRESLHSLRPTV